MSASAIGSMTMRPALTSSRMVRSERIMPSRRLQFGPERGRSSAAEHQLPKLRTRVRFSSPALTKCLVTGLPGSGELVESAGDGAFMAHPIGVDVDARLVDDVADGLGDDHVAAEGGVLVDDRSARRRGPDSGH